MANNSLGRVIDKFRSVLRTPNIEYDLTHYRKSITRIEALKEEYSECSHHDLRERFAALKEQARQSGSVVDVAAEAFAIIRETISRQLGLEPFEEQLLAGLAMLDGKIVDMKTGEGKTLSALFPICTAALLGKGVQVLTFNDYLARRDASWAAPVFESLALSSAFIAEGFTTDERRAAYRADICYLTAKEFGFDYLRDGIRQSTVAQVQRKFDFVLVDEADSILIDEARSPLVIADATGSGEHHLEHIDETVRALDPVEHLAIERHSRNISFTGSGIDWLEQRLGCKNLYADENQALITQLHYAAHAQHLLMRNRDYIVVGGQVKLVDEFTGRSAELRRWPDGLHDAVQAKEKISSIESARVMNSISFHDLFRLVPTVAGMTGTALESAAEFHRFFGLGVTAIPTHKRSRRVDLDDRVFATLEQKNAAILAAIGRAYGQRRPVLVGTSSVYESARMAHALQEKGIPFRVLNALNDSEEAQIISEAGRPGAVTLSTNMAGRGTDIVLGGNILAEKKTVEALGGLYVIGTNRHESERIDNQLRGRAGRQGDVGSSEFFISLEDPLFEKFGFRELVQDRIPTLPDSIGEDGEIVSVPLRILVIHLQKVIDGENLEIKKTLVKYSQVKERQRRHIREQRDELFDDPQGSVSIFRQLCPEKFLEVSSKLTTLDLERTARSILLHCVDKAWTDQQADLGDLQSCISLRALGGRAPHQEFQREADQWFIEHLHSIHSNAESLFDALQINNGQSNLVDLGLHRPSSTWTYQINDEMFGDMRDAMIRQPGLAAGLAMYGGPLLLLFLWFNRRSGGGRS